MSRALIGAGGWGYFSGGLPAYAKAFRFVEVNATFYRRVSETTARRWRSQVPADFTFAVKVHQDVTHRARLRPTPGARAALANDARVARVLRAPFLILETPPDLTLGPQELEGLRELAGIVDRGTRLGLEARAHATGPLPPALKRSLEDLAILDVVDLSRQAPRVPDDTVYTRLFGKGTDNVYEFDDEELEAIDRAGRDAKVVAYAFHGVRMYKDAARFLTFKRTGRFPRATSSVGLSSLEEVLRPDARFPMDREGLLQAHGWKVIDLDESRRVHAETLLARLPPRTYRDVEEVLSALSEPASGATR